MSRIGINLKSRRSTIAAAFRMAAALVRLLPRVDVVHVQGFSSKNILITMLAKLLGRPLVLHLQTARHDEPPAVRAQGRLAWWAFSSADLYLSVSPALATSYLAAGLSEGRIRHAPNAVDVLRFTPATAADRDTLRRRLGLPTGRPLILFVGVLSPDKQPDVLWEAWLRLQQDAATASSLVFVGATNPALFELGDRLAERLRAAAASSEFGNRVVFAPPTHQIEDYFRAADVFAMPSAREGSPIVLLEAMACALPCVVSDLPGATDVMLENGVTGVLVTPGDPSELAAGLSGIIGDPAAAARMGAMARQAVEHRYTFARIAETWLAAYRALAPS